MTLWSPDGCACQVELDGNGEPAKHVFVCERHAAAGVDHAGVGAECREKTAVLAEIAKARPGLLVGWKYADDCTLLIQTFADAAPADKEAVAAVVDKYARAEIADEAAAGKA